MPATGAMNETVIVTTPDGRFVLRRHRRRDRIRVTFAHDVIEHARDQGLPVPADRSTKGLVFLCGGESLDEPVLSAASAGGHQLPTSCL